MLTKIILGLLWLGFGLYAFLLAPPDQPDTINLIINLSTGKWQDINPLIIALFNLMGVWPLIYTSLLIIDGRDQKIIAWPFAFVSFAVGAFAILPYLTLRQPNSNFTGKKNLVIKLLDSPWLGVIALITAAILIAYGLINGNWSDFWHQWQTSRFIHVMSLDFCLLTLLCPILLQDDLTRRGLKNPLLLPVISLLPLIGPAIYLIIRPRLGEN
ncbi:MAG: DUF2834 domain-containing protein [Microcystis wesenbergii Mw_QC_S_20081001_S30D]|jgi:hypothetical protein|uniref:DUF2834 domain-containing protein n=1 Tax=Microcystis wesenbergii Mw_QC_S_20081001_S30D TaxID=2486245 RepID=A0A552J8N2_9CHRO|nr:DUF2834 domain-containing protein [Microcystis aeruginosa W11-03]NCR93528.1 DUF2834 domain-containing protein [Microcystis aeruginosa W11-06]TRU92007.1 MAG: DUF2834 domain-containing protein [Microcystis wesenbergii Mw_QC_S_20081001_S30D]TRU97673.1 MAG: DUF2834 domain-containing protein [Microcystis wesenbergii Mw_QC_S_20081001_S30]TRV00971.1 MAG: DUF2834 domain-containing protein [Microcystis wesenbergii Mw_QC_B_20070930_S4D]TRV12637.1 MAG: DUF2834 domain-containing protein [Microcystis we